MVPPSEWKSKEPQRKTEVRLCFKSATSKPEGNTGSETESGKHIQSELVSLF